VDGCRRPSAGASSLVSRTFISRPMGEIGGTCRVAAAALILARGTKALLIGERASQPDAGIILILMLALTAEAAWNAVPPDLRPVLKKYEQQRVEFVNEKVRALQVGEGLGSLESGSVCGTHRMQARGFPRDRTANEMTGSVLIFKLGHYRIVA
jgi:hypothetical protein